MTSRTSFSLSVIILLILVGIPARVGATAPDDPLIDLELERVIQQAVEVHDPRPAGIERVTSTGAIERIHRCGTPAPSPETEASLLAAISAREDELMSMSEVESQALATLRVPIAFWAIQNSSGEGELFLEQLEDQIRLLNQKYKKAKVKFHIEQAYLVTQNKWFKKCKMFKKNGKLSGAFKKMTRNLAVDPAHVLNVYSCAPKKLLGVAMFPSLLPEDHHWNAVVVHHESFPGGGAELYNLGYTAAHEIGHYFGLFHTFHNGCDFPGDEVSDTPYEDSPAYEAIPSNFCAAGRDTCPFEAGLDPVENIMDYSSDYCLEKFTKKQRSRMRAIIEAYRPMLME